MIKQLIIPKISLRSLIFILILIVYCITASETQGLTYSYIKYLFLLFGIFIESIYFFQKKYKNIYCKDEFFGLVIFAAVAFFYSLMHFIISSHFSISVLKELFFLIMPIIYSFLHINNSSIKEFHNCIVISFILSFYIYISSLNMSVSEIINALFNSNFINSNSDLESSIFSGISLGFAVYFIFKNNKIFKFLSILFVFMTFKRFSIFIVIILYLISFKKRYLIKKVDNKFLIITSITLFLTTIVYYFILNPLNLASLESILNVDMSKFTMTRSDRFESLYFSNYISYGFGSSNEFMNIIFNGTLEMDLIRIIVELGYLPLLLFIYFYLKLGKNNNYIFIFMLLRLFSMNFTSNLTSVMSWVISLSVMFSIIKENKIDEIISNNTSL